MYDEELYTGFPQFLISFPQVLNSFPQDESYKPLQTLQIVINLWKTLLWKTNDFPYRKLLPPCGKLFFHRYEVS